MSNEWFNNEFIGLCLDNGVEPVLSGDGQLRLICPKKNDKVLSGIISRIPKEQKYEVLESMKTATIVKIKLMLQMIGATGLSVKDEPDQHRVTVMAMGDMQQNEALQPDSPFWNEIAFVLKDDPYVSSYEIKCNSITVRDSATFNPDDNSILGSMKKEMEKVEAGDAPSTDPILQKMFGSSGPARSESPKVKLPAVTDDRFDYDRDFLPVDVGMDVKIMLESCSSVEEFLAQI